MNLLTITYIAYVVLSVGMTIWVARTLHKNGRIFLVDAFHGNEALADSVNHLLVVGFYLINLGYIALALATKQKVLDTANVVELVSTKVGVVMLVLGGMHFINLAVFSKMRRRAMEEREAPPVKPDEIVPVIKA
jgi:hypothetical protein